MATMKVKPWGKGQGDHVLIDEVDFNPDKHEKITESKAPAKVEKKPSKAPAKVG